MDTYASTTEPAQRRATVLATRANTCAVVLLAAATTATLADLLFYTHRSLVTTGDANLQRWVGAEPARWLYLGVVLLLAAAMVGAALATAHRSRGDVVRGRSAGTQDQAWLVGASSGLVAGLAAGLLLFLVARSATTIAALDAVPLVVDVVALVGALVVGVVGGRTTGRAGSGGTAGVWFGVLLALAAGFALLGSDTLFAPRLTAGPWATDRFGDTLCNGQTGDILASCALGDTAGTMAFMWLTFPLVGGALGALGGLAGRTRTRAALRAAQATGASRQAHARPGPGTVAIALCAVLLATLVAEAGFKLW